MQIRIKLFLLLIGCLLSLACNQIGSRSRYAPPPDTSYRIGSIDLIVESTLHTIRGAFVTPQFIEVVRVQPMLGRYFLDEEYQRNNQQVAVVGHKLWQQRLGSDPAMIGKALELNGRTYTVVGIMPKEFNAPEGVDVWLPEAETGR